jgi:carbamoyltransferase
MIILGIKAYYRDVYSALVRHGILVAAMEEERFRRAKHSS